MKQNTPATIKAAGVEDFTSRQREASTLTNPFKQLQRPAPRLVRWRVGPFLDVEIIRTSLQPAHGVVP